MNKKIILKLVLLLLINISNKIFSQLVSLTVNNVNGSGISSSQPISINANTTATVSLDTQVTLANAPSDNYPGTIKIYYQKNTSFPINVANGGDGGGLLFLGSTTAYRSFTITLNSGQFDATGGYIYAEYQTYSGIKYKSANKSVVVSATTGGDGGTGNSSGNCTSCEYYEIVPYAAVPISPELPISIPGSKEFTWVYYDYNNPTTFETPYDFIDRQGNMAQAYSSAVLKQKKKTYGIVSNTGEAVTIISYSKTFRIFMNRPFENISRLKFSNNIEAEQYLPYGSIPQTIVGNNAYIVSSDRNTPNIPVNNYQWQTRIANPTMPNWDNYVDYKESYGWKDIPNATQKDYTPTNSVNQARQYRRLVIDINNPANVITARKAVTSNVIGIYPTNNSNITNTICCSLTSGSESVQPFLGSDPTLDMNNHFYLWQFSHDNINWYNIDKEFSKDYTPNQRASRSNKVYYRRMVVKNDFTYYYPSNSVYVERTNRASKLMVENNDKNVTFNIYPNPSSSILNIEINSKNFPYSIKIIDLIGSVLISEKKINSKSLSLDISNLPKGMYNLIIEGNDEIFSKKIIKN